MDEPICNYYRRGHCKFGATCRKSHLIETCMKFPCLDEVCKKRHPPLCKFFMRYGKCKFETRCSYLHRAAGCCVDMKNQVEYLSNEIAVLKAQNDIMHREILKLQNQACCQDAAADVVCTSGNNLSESTNRNSDSDIPQFDGHDDISTVIDNIENRECISTFSLSSATLVSPSTLPLPQDDGTCVSCDAEYSGWDDFIDQMKKSNYMCFGCFDYYPDQPWFKRSFLVEVDAQCGSYLYLKSEL